MSKVVLGMSGGVDSSVAAIILQKEGYEVIGVTFQTIDDFDCNDAIEVCKKLNIEHHVMDIRKDFKEKVMDSFINDYVSGITPNPCVICNKFIKFKFLEDAKELYNADYIATGHYSSVKDGKLYMSVDLNKDQSYFICLVDKSILNHTLFPLEGVTKDEVRSIANEYGLINANKKDSYDVCFITDKFKDYLSKFVSKSSGDIVDISTNKVLGKHNGLMYYTVGQRRGLDVGGSDDRIFVVSKDFEKNILYVAKGSNNSFLNSNSCIITNVNFITDNKPVNCLCKFRYRSELSLCNLEYLSDGNVLVKYDNVKSVTSGQICAFYNENECLGGGIIKEVNK